MFRVKIRCVLILVFSLIARNVFAQFGEVHIGVNGLTCSQCTRNVELRLRQLGFIADVHMNLEHTDGVIRLKDAAAFDPSAIARAVKDAGFSLRFLKADLNNAGDLTNGTSCFRIKNWNYQLIPSGSILQSPATLQFIGPGFLPAGDLKRWRAELVERCQAKGSVYFVTRVNEEGE